MIENRTNRIIPIVVCSAPKPCTPKVGGSRFWRLSSAGRQANMLVLVHISMLICTPHCVYLSDQ